MEDPNASSWSGGESEAALRKARAIVSGRIVDIAGFGVLLQASDLRRGRAMGALLHDLDSHPGPAKLKISFSSATNDPPLRPYDECYDELKVWREGELLLLNYGGGINSRIDALGIQITGEGAALERAFHYIFTFGIAHLLGLHGRFLLHGGAIQREGRAMLLLGETGSGKSTLVLAALRNGWLALGDDLSVIRETADGLEVTGIAKRFAIPHDLEGSPSNGRPIPGDPRRRLVLVSHRWERGWYPVRATVSVAHSSLPHGELRTLMGSEILEASMGSFSAAREPILARKIFPLAA
jgi:hypothetical protein